MSHSLTKNWVHIIFSTKERLPLLTEEVEERVYEIIRADIIEMKCHLDCINGMADHIHLLLLLHPTQALAMVVKQIKGSSSHTINQNDWLNEKFSWQTGYSAFSVSESQVNRVRKYIQNQKIHHLERTFGMEIRRTLKTTRFIWKRLTFVFHGVRPTQDLGINQLSKCCDLYASPEPTK